MADHLERDERIAALSELRLQLFERGIDRRDFVKRAAHLGLAAPAIGAMLHVCGANAAPNSRAAVTRSLLQDEPQNPIAITVGGTPIAVTEEDTSNATPGGVLRFARAEDSTNFDPISLPLNLLNAVSRKVHDFEQSPTGQWNWKRTWIEQ